MQKIKSKKIILKNEFITLDGHPRVYGSQIPVVGLTGGIASGKSTVSTLLKEKGLPVICGDNLTKEIYKENESLDFISNHFPHCMGVSTSGGAIGIDFPSLRKEFFNNLKSKQIIENYIWSKHPIYFHKVLANLDTNNFVIYDYPIIFEQKLDHLFDLILVVYADFETQKKRLKLRDGIDDLLAQNILATQLPMEQKIKLVNKSQIIDNCGDSKALELEVERFFNDFLYIKTT
ncbi:MAG: dephospho-CoA kinase [Oligoflexia bacterium]|nr:dephospho-CoA kinase [Oligoflexia bacterium]